MTNKKKVVLSEDESPAFQEFMKKATAEYQKSGPDNMEDFTQSMLYFMNDNKSQIRYVGQGSSRLVFAMADGTALKLAKTNAGIAQNKHEAKICMDPQMKYQIFPDFYGADTKHWLSLNCELCAKAEKKDFAQIFKIQPQGIVNVIEFIMKMKLERWELSKARDHFQDLGSNVYAYFIQQLIDNKTLAIQAINSLLDFYQKNGLDELLLGDLEEVRNWGIAIREGQKVLVIIDAGFSEDIWQQHYAPKKRSFSSF